MQITHFILNKIRKILTIICLSIINRIFRRRPELTNGGQWAECNSDSLKLTPFDGYSTRLLGYAMNIVDM